MSVGHGLWRVPFTGNDSWDIVVDLEVVSVQPQESPSATAT